MYGYQGAYSPYGNAQPAHHAYQAPHQYYSPTTANTAYPAYGYPASVQAQHQAATAGYVPPPPTAPNYATNNYYGVSASTHTVAKSQGPSKGHGGGFSSYDAAVYAAANSYLQSKNAGTAKTWMKGPFRKKLNTDPTQYYCSICNISCAGGQTYKEHIEGKNHKKREAQQKGEKTVTLPRNKLAYRCDLCSVTCAGQDTYAAHVRGSKHVKAVALLKKLGKPVPEDIPTIIAPNEGGVIETKAKSKWHQQELAGTNRVVGIDMVQFVPGDSLSTTVQLEQKKKEVMDAVGGAGKPAIEVEDEKLKAMMAAEEVKPVGEEHVSAERDSTGKLIQYICNLCDCKFSDPNAKDIHLKGRRHRLAYKQKIDPKLVVDPKPSTKRGRDAKQRKEINGAQKNALMPRVPWFGQQSAEGRRFEILDERHFEERHNQIMIRQDVHEKIEKLAQSTEETLKNVSSEIEATRTDVSSEEEQKKPRVLQGCQRVGSFASELFMTGENLFEMVVLCTPPPTIDLVQRVKHMCSEKTPDIVTFSNDPTSASCLLVNLNGFPDVTCRLLFTSPTLRDAPGDVQCSDRATCLNALAKLRRSKWFLSRCIFLQSCQKVIRIFRDIRTREVALNCLDDHLLALIVEKVLFTSHIALSPANAFRLVLEALSSGILLQAVLHDPCEREKTNVFDLLSEEKKHEVTVCAQNMLRLVSFNQIYQVLGIERLPDIRSPFTRNLKRTADEFREEEQYEDVEEPDIKKEKGEESQEGNHDQND